MGHRLRTRGAGIEASDELRAAALAELALQNIDLNASGGRQNDAGALAGERTLASWSGRQRAANDPGGPKRCGFCRKVREKISKTLFPKSA